MIDHKDKELIYATLGAFIEKEDSKKQKRSKNHAALALEFLDLVNKSKK